MNNYSACSILFFKVQIETYRDTMGLLNTDKQLDYRNGCDNPILKIHFYFEFFIKVLFKKYDYLNNYISYTKVILLHFSGQKLYFN